MGLWPYIFYFFQCGDQILTDISELKIRMPKDAPRTERVNPYSAGIYFSHQNLTSADVRF